MAMLGVALLVNCIASFGGALVCVALAVRLGHSPRLAKWVLVLPFVKAAVDLGRGPQSGAYVLSDRAGEMWELGQFAVGFGLQRPLVPVIQARLGALFDGRWYPLSAGDVVARRAVLHLGGRLSTALVVLCAVVSMALLIRRLHAFWRFRRDCAAALGATSHEARVRVAGRQVRVVVTDTFEMSFTSGLIRPVIWLTPSCWSLPVRQRDAVIAHELAHVRDRDVLLYGLVGLLADVFWFLPGARWLVRRVHHHGELAADARALRAGASPVALARAIVAQAEAGMGRVALGGRSRDRRARLSALLAASPPSRWRAVVHAAIILALGGTALASSFGGYF